MHLPLRKVYVILKKNHLIVLLVVCPFLDKEDPNDPDAHLPYQPTTEDSESLNAADITDPDEYDRIFKPHHTVPRSPSQVRAMTSRRNVSSEYGTDAITKLNFGLPPSSPNIVNPTPHEAKCVQSNILSNRFTSDKPFTPPSTTSACISRRPHQTTISQAVNNHTRVEKLFYCLRELNDFPEKIVLFLYPLVLIAIRFIHISSTSPARLSICH
ncbi:unnamed protein product [Schistosoma curassoni]|uniref:SH2 domain-containing protein n=1 Tax=Schistosoma curassoni TaxID=6186 RepID=A0A183JVA7_9TREM|nr:unnamed protein product [Schistosoma curassoni]